MKKLFSILAMLLIGIGMSFAQKGLEDFHIPTNGTFDTYKQLENAEILYVPPVQGTYYLSRSSYWGYSAGGYLFDDKTTQAKITSVTNIGKPKDPYLKMEWIIANGNKSLRCIVYTNNYDKKLKKGEFLISQLPLYDKKAWIDANSDLIGKVYTNPKVKATYKVVDLEYKRDLGNHDLKTFCNFVVVENSASGKRNSYKYTTAAFDAFEEDLSGKYYTYLAKVEKPSNPAVKYGSTKVIEDDKNRTKFSYQDNFIDIIILGNSQQFSFTLKNVSGSTQKIIWDDAVFVDYSGTTSKIMHQGIKYSQREASMPATTIIKGASVEDLACPTSNVRYSDILKEWVTDSMYPKQPALEGKQVSLMLPIQIKDVVNEYIFVFDLKYKYNHPERLNLE